MIIKVPEEYHEYFLMLLEAVTYNDKQEAILAVMDVGLDICKCVFPTIVLEGPQTSVEIADNPELLERLEQWARFHKVSVSKIARINFVQGLFEFYPVLKNSHLYKTNADFRKAVDKMPQPMFPSEECMEAVYGSLYTQSR